MSEVLTASVEEHHDRLVLLRGRLAPHIQAQTILSHRIPKSTCKGINDLLKLRRVLWVVYRLTPRLRTIATRSSAHTLNLTTNINDSLLRLESLKLAKFLI